MKINSQINKGHYTINDIKLFFRPYRVGDLIEKIIPQSNKFELTWMDNYKTYIHEVIKIDGNDYICKLLRVIGDNTGITNYEDHNLLLNFKHESLVKF